jgi:hypothetical protein
VAIRRVVADLALDPGLLPDDVELSPDGPLDPAPFEAHEVLVASDDPERLAEAGRLGLQRLVPGDDPEATSAAVAELVELLDR